MGDDKISDHEKARFVSIIHDESQRLTRLLDEILDINRLEAGTVNLPLEPVEMNAAVAAALDSVAGMTRDRNVAVDVAHGPDGLRVLANGDRLRQVLINLLSNAVKYNTAEDPRIDIRTRLDGEDVLVDVVDNGGGVTREDAATIFDRFARGSRASSDAGAGLGLPISRAFMHAMNGKLTVQFQADGTSFFRLSLPLTATV